MKRLLLITIILIAFSCKTKETASVKTAETVETTTKPNILIIHVDDMGYYDLGVNGSVLHNTPEIDGLASQSVAFSNAYSSYPRCTPSRYGMMTATYPVNENKGHLGGISEKNNFISFGIQNSCNHLHTF